MARGDKGINPLDAACREHDISYTNHKDSEERYKADLKLKSIANQRVFARDSSVGERLAAATVSAAMKIKTIGSGFKRRKSTEKPKTITFGRLVSGVRINVKKSKPKTVESAVKAAIGVARKLRSGKHITKIPRIIKVPSISGGLPPILPILSGLAASGTIANTIFNIVKAFKTIKSSNKNDQKKIGNGLYLRPYRNGKGLYLAPYKQGKGLYLRPFPKN